MLKKNRTALVESLRSGDIFHARKSNSEASLICLVEFVSSDTIHARRVTVQGVYDFNRKTGEAMSDVGEDNFRIDSVAPLPVEIHNAILGLDRKNRLLTDVEQIKLTEPEKQALLFVAPYYADNQI